jgi:hypothetical protein
MFSIFIPTPTKKWEIKNPTRNTINSQPATHKWYTQNMFTRLSHNSRSFSLPLACSSTHKPFIHFSSFYSILCVQYVLSVPWMFPMPIWWGRMWVEKRRNEWNVTGTLCISPTLTCPPNHLTYSSLLYILYFLACAVAAAHNKHIFIIASTFLLDAMLPHRKVFSFFLFFGLCDEMGWYSCFLIVNFFFLFFMIVGI